MRIITGGADVTGVAEMAEQKYGISSDPAGRSRHRYPQPLALMTKFASPLILLLVPLCAIAGSQVEWRGYKLHEVQSIADIPASIRDQLGAQLPGLDGTADKGQPFNPTDNVDSSLPMRRFLVAGYDHDTWLVALERGGRGCNIQVYRFVGTEQRDHWVMLVFPRTLQDIAEPIPHPENGK